MNKPSIHKSFKVFTFTSIISAVDPVAVLAIFSEVTPGYLPEIKSCTQACFQKKSDKLSSLLILLWIRLGWIQTFTTWSLESRWSTMELLWYRQACSCQIQYLSNSYKMTTNFETAKLCTVEASTIHVLKPPTSGSVQNDEQFCRDHVRRGDSHPHQLPHGTS